MARYYENFEYLGPRISSDSSIMSLSYSSYSRGACCTEDCFTNIQHMIILGYNSQLCPSRSVKEVVHPALPYIENPFMIHLNKTKEGRWRSKIFIPRFHNIYCLSFHLKHEGMNYIIDNFKSSRIIVVTNMIV